MGAYVLKDTPIARDQQTAVPVRRRDGDSDSGGDVHGSVRHVPRRRGQRATSLSVVHVEHRGVGCLLRPAPGP